MDPRLFDTVTSGEIDVLKQLADENTTVLLQLTPQKNTALHIAATFGHIELVQEIHTRCQTLLMQPNLKGDTPLHIAAREGRYDIIQLLINYKSGTTFYGDVESGGLDAAVEVLRVKNMKEDTALHEALRSGHLEIAKLLITADHELSRFVNSAGESAMYLAVEKGMVEIVDLILQHCPSCEHCGPNGWTALRASIVLQHDDITKSLLLKRPRLIKEADNNGWTPLHYAVHLGYIVIVQQLLESDSSVAYVLDSKNISALHIAAHQGNIDAVKMIIRFCPDSSELLDKKGRNALHVATLFGRDNVVRYFLETQKLGNLINEADSEGNTPLHLASIYGQYKIVKIFMQDIRVDSTAMNKDNKTALDAAESEFNKGIDLLRFCTKWNLKNGGAKWSPRSLIKGGDMDAQKQYLCNYNMLIANARMHVLKEIGTTNLIVATIIATVTFAAGFTMPGGYNSDDKGPNKGMATLATSLAFKTFVISDTIAFCFSAISMYLFLVAVLWDNLIPMAYTVTIATQLTLYAIWGMLIAFNSGLYAVLAHAPALAISVCVICSTSFLLLSSYTKWILPRL